MQDTSGHDVQKSEKENTPEYIYKIEANPRSDSIENRYFLQAYEAMGNGEAIPVMCCIDRFTYDYDTGLYRDNSQSMTVNVSEIAEALKQRDTHDIALWLAEIAADGTEPEERKRAMELLEKLAEYKPLAKIEEMEGTELQHGR